MTEMLYPFLDSGAETPPAELHRSTAEKADEIVALRRAILAADGARLAACASRMAEAFRAGGRLFAFGNGGSSTDAQDVAALFLDPGDAWRPLPALALTADVAVVTNITDDHLGVDDIESVEDLVEIKALVAEEIRIGGHVVLGADDPRVAALADRPAVVRRRPVIRYFCMSSANPVIGRHLRRGGVAYFVEDGWLVEATGGRTDALLPVADVAGSFAGKADHVIANALAAAAAARALDVPASMVVRGLRTFAPHRCNPGRGCAFHLEETPILVDYAHNPAAVAAVGGLLRRVWDRDGVAAVTLPGDRCDELVVDTARAVAGAFDRVVVYEDEDLRGRRPGEMTRLIVEGLTTTRPDVRIRTAGDLKDAVGIALGIAAPGEPVLLLYEKLQPVADLLQILGATAFDGSSPSTPKPT